MSDKTRIAVIFGAAVVLAGGGLYYFFKVYQPKQERGVAATEIEAWEQRLDQVRLCLLGPTPASSKSGEALAIRELAPDVWDRASCTKLVGKLSRGVAEDTGLLEVEHAWMTVDRAAARVAGAFASHVDPSGESSEKRGKDSPLPAALDELDVAAAELRHAAGMDPRTTTAPDALPEAELITIKDGSDPVSSLTAWLTPSAGGTLGFGVVKGKGEVQLTLVPGAAPVVSKLGPGSVRAVPTLTWGAAALSQQIAIGAIDPAGGMTQIAKAPTEFGGRLMVAVGSLPSGLVAYAASNQLVVARSSGSSFVEDKPIAVGRMTSALDPSGRGLVAWSLPTEEGHANGFIAKDGTKPTIVDLGSGYASQSCLTPTKGWVGGEDQFISFDDTGAVPHVLPEHELLGCFTEGALLHKYGSTHYAVCGDTCRVADLTGLRPTTIAAVAGGKVYAMRTRGRVIGVWTEGKPARFFAMPTSITPTLATSNGKVIDVLAETDTAAVVVRLPL
ncbi:hypothetical protein BH11MYX3_BH11MYX3_28950 [soil metagenome]